QLYVAKKYFDIGNEPTAIATATATAEVSKADNDVALAKDLFRLKRLAMWRCEYMQLAAVKNFTEVADFEVSPGFLISTIKNSDSDDDDDEAAFEPVTYLVEPLRSTSVVRKFSGTLGATQDTDKLALTILSFSHFMLDVTACAISMVDLQGAFFLPGAVRRLTLFDPMSHTITEDSGIGDFGATGIQDSIETHQCSLYCHGLGLSSTQVLKATLARQRKEAIV
ncbi:hypothetical protein B0H17DRAFT_957441, partial [Mycena rosella]